MRPTGGSSVPFDLSALHFTHLSIRAYVGGAVDTIGYVLASVLEAGEEIVRYLRSERLLDRAKIEIVPCYHGEQATVNVSIGVFSCIAKAAILLAHTKGRRKRCKTK